jgi:hypothetical protein
MDPITPNFSAQIIESDAIYEVTLCRRQYKTVRVIAKNEAQARRLAEKKAASEAIAFTEKGFVSASGTRRRDDL